MYLLFISTPILNEELGRVEKRWVKEVMEENVSFIYISHYTLNVNHDGVVHTPN